MTELHERDRALRRRESLQPRAELSLRQKNAAHLALNFFERRNPHVRFVAVRSAEQPALIVELERFERPGVDIDQPVVGDSPLGVQVPLEGSIARGRARLEDLTNPVRHHVDRPLLSGIEEALAPPAGEIRTDDVVRSELDVDLDEDPPSSRPAVAVIAIEWVPDEASERALCLGVLRERRRRGDDRAAQDLSLQLIRKFEQVVTGRKSRSGFRHPLNLALSRGPLLAGARRRAHFGAISPRTMA